MKRRVLILLMAMSITGAALAGCGSVTNEDSVSESSANALLMVSTVSPAVTDINIKGEFVGTLEYDEQISVFPLLSGEITGTYFEDGDYVEEGELMFTLDDKAYQLQLQNANTTYESAETGLQQQLGALEMQRNNAINTLHSAQEGIRQIEDTYDYYNVQKSDLDETKENLQSDRNDMKDDLNKLRDDRTKAKDDLKDAETAMEKDSKAYADALMANAANPAAPPIPQATLTILKSKMDASVSAYSSLAQKVAAYDSAEKQMESAIKQYDSSMDQIDSSKEGLQFQQDNLDYSLAQAKRGEILAQNNLDYFDNYTAPLTQHSAELTLSQAGIGISSAQLQLSYTKIKAPISGKVIAKNNDVGDLAQAGYPVYMILPEDTINASFGVPESVWRNLNIGDKITVERNGEIYDAKVTEIPTGVNPQTGMFVIKATVSGNTDSLVTGTSVIVSAVTQSLNSVMTIPIDCVYYEGGNSYTYVVNNDGVVSKIYIETGLYDDVNMEIKSGITKDMKVITTWSSDLHDGLVVNVDNESVSAN